MVENGSKTESINAQNPILTLVPVKPNSYDLIYFHRFPAFCGRIDRIDDLHEFDCLVRRI